MGEFYIQLWDEIHDDGYNFLIGQRLHYRKGIQQIPRHSYMLIEHLKNSLLLIKLVFLFIHVHFYYIELLQNIFYFFLILTFSNMASSVFNC